MSDPQDQLYEIIRKNLPQHVGETLRSELDALSALRDTVKRQNATMSDQVEVIKSLKGENRRLAEQVCQHALLDAREKELTQREQAAEVTELRMKLLCEQEKTKLATDLALSLTRNTEYRQTVFGSTSVAVNHPGSYPGQVTSTPYNHEKKETAE